MRRSFLLLPFLLTGCLKTYVVEMSDPAADAHYVVIQSGASGNSRVYDCQARPNGTDWDPTCIKARMLASPPSKPAE